MSVFAEPRPLIIGIGNPLRSDDGLGWTVVEQLAGEGDVDCTIHTVHQLTPELAQWMAMGRLVVMIDASCTGEPGTLHVRHLLSPSVHPGAVGTHHTTPEELVAFTTAVYGYCPPVVVVTMTGAHFGLGEQLSPIVAGRLSLVREAVRQVCVKGSDAFIPGPEETRAAVVRRSTSKRSLPKGVPPS